MKRLYITIIVTIAMLCDLSLPSNAQQAFYIYRNDTGIQTLLTSAIDSITYSCLGIDSILQEDYVTQEIWTLDTVYRIPLVEIDSIGFVTPETIYQPDVIVLDGELRQHIILRDSFAIVFDSSTPHNLLPNIGSKLVSTESDNILDKAFIGEVIELKESGDGTKVVCSACALTDVFEQYYGITEVKDYADSIVTAKTTRSSLNGIRTTGWQTYTPGTLKRNLLNSVGLPKASYKGNDNTSASASIDNIEASVAVTPNFKYIASLTVNKVYGVAVEMTVIGDYTLEELLAMKGSAEFSGEKSIFKHTVHIPQVLSDITFDFGLFCNGSASLAIEERWTQKYRQTFHWGWSSKGVTSVKNTHTIKRISSSHTGECAIDGNLNIGAYSSLGMSFIYTSDLAIASIGLRLDGGISVDGSFVAYKNYAETAKTSTEYYNKVKDCKVDLNWFYGTKAWMRLFGKSHSYDIPNVANLPFSNKGLIASLRCVPLFSDTKVVQTSIDTYQASVNIAGNVSPSDIGFAVINKDNPSDAQYLYSLANYSGPSSSVSASLKNLKTNVKYNVYPLVKFMGLDMIAEPFEEIKLSNIPAITDFTVTNTQHSKGAFTYDGKIYDYRFDAAVTVSIADLTDVVDWGYVYKDPDGKTTEISLNTFGQSYTDSRYAYYRNEPSFTVCLYGYVRYSGSSETIYGEPQYFNLIKELLCPDDNHPHAIDLGVGVKWACCNVGAKEPVECGNYYAWGETTTKYTYDLSSYKFWYGWRYIDYDYDELEPPDDAATVNWGSKWRMPTAKDFQKIIDNCKWTWIRLNDIGGMKITGPNGYSIFLPAAEEYVNDHVYGANLNGRYWTKTRQDSSFAWAYCLHFGISYFDGVTNDRPYFGLSVRPVSQ